MTRKEWMVAMKKHLRISHLKKDIMIRQRKLARLKAHLESKGQGNFAEVFLAYCANSQTKTPSPKPKPATNLDAAY